MNQAPFKVLPFPSAGALFSLNQNSVGRDLSDDSLKVVFK